MPHYIIKTSQSSDNDKLAKCIFNTIWVSKNIWAKLKACHLLTIIQYFLSFDLPHKLAICFSFESHPIRLLGSFNLLCRDGWSRAQLISLWRLRGAAGRSGKLSAITYFDTAAIIVSVLHHWRLIANLIHLFHFKRQSQSIELINK